MPPDNPSVDKHLQEIKEILSACGAAEIMLLAAEAMGTVSGGEIYFLVKMADDRTLLDIVPAEEELAGLLGLPVFIIPEQSLHPDQSGRLRDSGRTI